MAQSLKEICLEITSSCPLNCIHCSNDNKNYAELDFYEILNVINDFTNLGGQILEISGGEPLEHNHILRIIRYAKKKKLDTRLYTSGIISHTDSYTSFDERLIIDLKKSGLDKIIFNIEGSNQIIHESITNLKNSYDKVIESILKTISVGIWVGVHFVPTKLNYRDLENVVEVYSYLGVDELGVLRFVPQGRGFDNRSKLELSNIETNLLFNNIKKIIDTQKLKIRIGHHYNSIFSITNLENNTKCQAGISQCLIKSNGDVVPCPAFKQNSDYVIGNIKKNSLIDLWRNSLILKQLREFNYKNLLSCNKCDLLSKCHGGCIAQQIITWGELHRGCDPGCLKNLSKKFSEQYLSELNINELRPLRIAIQE